MQSFPMFLKMTGRRVVIVGGGEEAARKARLILKTEAALDLLSPDLDDELSGLVAEGRARHLSGPLTPDVFRDTALVFIGTGCPATDVCAHDLAKQAGALVNVVDNPALCDATTPSIVDRDPVVVAIGTEGTAPVLGRTIKTQIEAMLDPRIGAFAALAGRLRDAVARQVPQRSRRAFWDWVFKDAPWQAFQRGADHEAARLIKEAIATGKAGSAGRSLCLIVIDPAAPDLLPLRAVARLQEADMIHHPATLDPGFLELARRDAQRATLVPAITGWWHAPCADAVQGARVVCLVPALPDLGAAVTSAQGRGLACELIGARIPEVHETERTMAISLP